MIEENSLFKLLVEGNDDLRVVSAFWKDAKLPEVFDIKDCKGFNKLLTELKLRLTTPQNNRRIGVVVDADQDISARWDAIKSKLVETGKYNCKGLMLPHDGLILPSIDSEFPTIGVWIMPNNTLPGMLEDFVATLSEPEDVLMKKADEVLDELERGHIQKYKAVHRAKAKIHSFLAWQDEPGKPMGVSITSHVLKPNSPTGVIFLDWLKKLFL